MRKKIRVFFKASRRNLLRKFASINRTTFRKHNGRVFSLNLTYPDEYPQDPNVCKGHLKALRKRLTRRFGKDFAGFWRMRIQKRGAWHFHLLILAGPSFVSMTELRPFVATAWYEVCGRVSESHLRAGTRVEEVRTWKKATSYAEKYLARDEGFPEGLATGRIWGVWNGQVLSPRWEKVQVSLRDAFEIRRIFRRLAGLKGTGPLRRLTVFARHENVVRLLEFLGYCRGTWIREEKASEGEEAKRLRSYTKNNNHPGRCSPVKGSPASGPRPGRKGESGVLLAEGVGGSATKTLVVTFVLFLVFVLVNGFFMACGALLMS